MNIGDKVAVNLPSRKPRLCTCVDILKAHKQYPPDLIEKYYRSRDCMGEYRAIKHDRLVFQVDSTGGYIIIPRIFRNSTFWRVLT